VLLITKALQEDFMALAFIDDRVFVCGIPVRLIKKSVILFSIG
jgi:hypothetical protein